MRLSTMERTSSRRAGGGRTRGSGKVAADRHSYSGPQPASCKSSSLRSRTACAHQDEDVGAEGAGVGKGCELAQTRLLCRCDERWWAGPAYRQRQGGSCLVDKRGHTRGTNQCALPRRRERSTRDMSRSTGTPPWPTNGPHKDSRKHANSPCSCASSASPRTIRCSIDPRSPEDQIPGGHRVRAAARQRTAACCMHCARRKGCACALSNKISPSGKRPTCRKYSGKLS